MSGRAARKLLKTKDQSIPQDDHLSDNESDGRITQRDEGNLFAVLSPHDEELPSEEEEDDQKVSVPLKSKPRQRKKKKATKQDPKVQPELNDDEFDELLKTIQKDDQPIISNYTDTPKYALEFDSKNFDWEAELIRKFGAAALGQDMPKSAKKSRRKYFVIPKQNWPPFRNPGLLAIPDEIETGKYQLKHSFAYQKLDHLFYQSIQLHDSYLMEEILKESPFHLLTLLQLSDMAKQSGEADKAFDMLERAIFGFEHALHLNFSLNGTFELSYQRVENRPIFIILFRFIQALSSKGCWRSALEYSKFLLSLDKNDPLHARVLIDIFAIQSQQFDWYLSYWSKFKDSLVSLISISLF
jgi:hypothetical protein